MKAAPAVAAIGSCVAAWVSYQAVNISVSQLKTMEDERQQQALSLDLSTRAILEAPFEYWKIVPNIPEAGKSPTLSFIIKNVGRTHAQLLAATYEYTLSQGLPVAFGKPVQIENFPALLPPNVHAPIIISGLPAFTQDNVNALNKGKNFIWIRTIFFYRDDKGTEFEIRFTGRYGRGTNADGRPAFLFSFPDAVILLGKWNSSQGARCLNVVGSEPINLDCKIEKKKIIN